MSIKDLFEDRRVQVAAASAAVGAALYFAIFKRRSSGAPTIKVDRSSTPVGQHAQAAAASGHPDSAVMGAADVQHALNALGFGPIAEDGAMGPETEGAVRRFQADANITVDGKVGPVTSAALRAALAGGMVGGLAVVPQGWLPDHATSGLFR